MSNDNSNAGSLAGSTITTWGQVTETEDTQFPRPSSLCVESISPGITNETPATQAWTKTDAPPMLMMPSATSPANSCTCLTYLATLEILTNL